MSDEYEYEATSQLRDAQLDPSPDALTPQAGANADSQQAAQVGAMLRQMRESAGVDLMLLASTLKVTPQKIQALEDGRFGDLPDMTFARGLAAAVCRAFGNDPDPVLTLMPVVARGLQVETGVLRQPSAPVAFRTGGSGGEGLSRWFVNVPGWLTVVVCLLLIGVLVVWFWPRYTLADADLPQAAGSAVSAASDQASAVAVEQASEPDAASALDGGTASVPASDTVPGVAASAPAMPASEAASKPKARASAASAPQAAASAASAPDSALPGSGIVESNVITFSATGQVWVGVTDGSGKMVLSRNLDAGDTVNVGGELPLSVTVGNKTAVAVMVRGEPFDLDKHASRTGTVARFKINPAQPSLP